MKTDFLYILIIVGVFMIAFVLIPTKKKKQKPENKTEKEDDKKEDYEEIIPENELPIGKISGKSFLKLKEERKKREVYIDEEEFDITPEEEQTESFEEYFNNMFDGKTPENMRVEISSDDNGDYDKSESELIEKQKEQLKQQADDFFSKINENIQKNQEFIKNIDKIMNDDQS